VEIIVETTVKAPLAAVWAAWNSPEDILEWNAPSDDWHTTRAEVDLREGGRYSSHMAARNGSYGFDFEGTYRRIIPQQRIEAEYAGRSLTVEFIESFEGVTVRETIETADTFPVEQQRTGSQAILNSFKRYVEAKTAHRPDADT
jgi:uncharacterized protein YndB with AHSA1/START domain